MDGRVSARAGRDDGHPPELALHPRPGLAVAHGDRDEGQQIARPHPPAARRVAVRLRRDVLSQQVGGPPFILDVYRVEFNYGGF